MKRLLFLAIISLFSSLSLGVEVSPHPQQITMSVDADLIAFVKMTIWLGGAFLAIYALVGGIFFGWDVRKARGSIIDAQKEVKELLNELRDDYASLKDLKERLEELGALLQQESESLHQSIAISGRTTFGVSAPVLGDVAAVSQTPYIAGTRSNIDLIREVIASSNYEWTTIRRIMNKTGLSHDEILREARSAPDIKIGNGRQTKDFLFKFYPLQADLEQHA